MGASNLTKYGTPALLVSCLAIASLTGCGTSPETPLTKNSGATLNQLEVSLPGTIKNFPTDDRGGLITNAEVASGDGRVSLSIAAGTSFQDRDGKPASSIRLQASPTAPPQTGGSAVIGTTYSFTPAGITCSRPISITMSYLPDILPAGINKTDVFIASYENGAWESMRYKQVDTEKHIVTTQIDHSAMYAVLVKLPTPGTTASIPNTTTSTPSTTTSTTIPATGTVDRVELLYFHSAQRCKTCLYFEERTRHVMSTFFKNEVQSGMLSLTTINRGDKANYPLVQKYEVVGSQLFINTIVNGVESSRNVWEIYSWGTNDSAFDAGLKAMIQKSLKGELQ